MREEIQAIPSLADGMAFLLRGIADAVEAVGAWFAFAGTEAGATIVIGLLATIVAAWAIISQRSVARRQATMELIFQQDGDAEVIEARRRFNEIAQSNGGVERYVSSREFTQEEDFRYRKVLQKLLKNTISERLKKKLILEALEGESNEEEIRSIIMRANHVSDQYKNKISKKIARKVAKEVIISRSNHEQWEKSRDQIRRVLNECEAIAVGIHNGAYDYKVWKHWNKASYIRIYYNALPYITAIRSQKNYQKFYSEFEALVSELEGRVPVKRRRWLALLW